MRDKLEEMIVVLGRKKLVELIEKNRQEAQNEKDETVLQDVTKLTELPKAITCLEVVAAQTEFLIEFNTTQDDRDKILAGMNQKINITITYLKELQNELTNSTESNS